MLLDEIQFYVKLRDKKDQIFKPIVDIIPNWLSPNLITWLRFILIFPLCYLWWLATSPFFIWQEWTWYLTGIVIFFGPFTDYLDGAVARLTDRITTFGIYFDPITDKLFSIPVFLIFVWQWPWLSSLLFLINLRILLILLTLVKASFHKKERLSRALQYGYIFVSFIGYLIFIIKFVLDYL